MERKLEQRLHRAAAGFLALQRRQAEALEGGAVGDLSRWRHQRQAAFQELALALQGVAGAGAAAAGLAPAVARLAEEIRRNEERLAQAVADHRQRVEEELARLRRGRRTLAGYGGAGRSRPRLRRTT